MFNLGNAKKSVLGTKNPKNNYNFDEANYIYDESIKNDSRIAISRLVKEKSVVLDIGCASGILGCFLFKYKRCTVDGIEYDKEAAKLAKSKGYYRDIYAFSISDINDKNYKNYMESNHKYDYIIFADVLEHLVDPWNAIVNVSKCLKRNGKIIISVPNIAHIDIIKALINCEFNYDEYGILDQTHLRFFTPSSFNDMVKNIAEEHNVFFNVERTDNIIIEPEYYEPEKFKILNKNTSVKEYLSLQNIYILSLASNKNDMQSNIVNKNKNSFYKIIDDYNNLCINNKKQLEYINDLKKENKKLNEELGSILNSKRWNYVNKILRIFGK